MQCAVIYEQTTLQCESQYCKQEQQQLYNNNSKKKRIVITKIKNTKQQRVKLDTNIHFVNIRIHIHTYVDMCVCI